MKKGAKKVVVKPQKTVKASIKVMGMIFTSEGVTVKEAILNLKPTVSRGVSVLVVERDGKKTEKILGNWLTQRLFGAGSNMTKEIAIKQATTLFG